MEAEKEVCEEIKEIVRDLREQEASGDIGTPGGLEHMDDVWSLLKEWDAKLTAKQATERKGEGKR